MAEYFMKNVFLLLTPQSVDPAHPFPYMSNLSLNIGLTAERHADHEHTGALISGEFSTDDAVRFVRIKVPPLCPRLVAGERRRAKICSVGRIDRSEHSSSLCQRAPEQGLHVSRHA
jgi:polyphosphate kinase